MSQNQTDQATGRQAGEDLIEELRVLIRDVRTWFEAMPIRVDPTLSVIAAVQDAVGPAPVASGRPVSDATPESVQLDVAAAALDAHADALSATAERAAEAVRERGDRIDAILAEIRHIRAETVPA